MLSSAFNTILYVPLYNVLILLTSIVPWADMGIAVVILTILIKLVILPLTHKSTKSQVRLRELNPEIKEIKNKYKDKQEQAKKTMELYKKHGINPFSGCLVALVQLPIIIALYWVFLKGIKIDQSLILASEHTAGYIHKALLNQDILYSFVHMPEIIKIKFIGLIDITEKSIVLAVLAGISQYFQIKLSMPMEGKPTLKNTGSIKDDLAQSMKFQMRYILPVFVAFFAYSISAAVALYWLTSNLFTIAHEIIVKKEVNNLKNNSNK
ncbi:MAG TPA: YidC/Oxa1 family membrane protein insertase [Ignavibacteria bacterium]|nr:YidC/Oxa1 family membrane protein insertase [Ignavibacteria bacterium]